MYGSGVHFIHASTQNYDDDGVGENFGCVRVLAAELNSVVRRTVLVNRVTMAKSEKDCPSVSHVFTRLQNVCREAATPPGLEKVPLPAFFSSDILSTTGMTDCPIIASIASLTDFLIVMGTCVTCESISTPLCRDKMIYDHHAENFGRTGQEAFISDEHICASRDSLISSTCFAVCSVLLRFIAFQHGFQIRLLCAEDLCVTR